jgi:hypothetical protein
MTKNVKTIDLNTNLLYSEKSINFFKTFFGLDVFGVCVDKNMPLLDKQESIVLRKKRGSKTFNAKDSKDNFFFIKSSIFEGNSNEIFYDIDVLTIKSLNNIKPLLKKYNGSNIGIEFLINDIRYYNNDELGKWFFDMKWIYRLCKKYNLEFILSSGASVYYELMPIKIFNIILEKLDIEKGKYWDDLNIWLDDKKRSTLFYDTK